MATGTPRKNTSEALHDVRFPDEAARRRPPTAIPAKLYGLRGAAPSMAAQLMLEHKGVRYRRVNMVPGRHRKKLPRRGFPAGTAPALELDGRLVQPNRAIARALDAVVPEPPLFPGDPEARQAVEEAERFGDEVLQHATRRIMIWTLHADPHSAGAHPRLGRLLPAALPAWLQSRLLRKALAGYGVTAAIADDLRALPDMLDRIDAFIAEGVLNGARLNAADFQIAPLICALMTLADHEPGIAQRPSAALASRVLPAE
jgi:glutathione S-transferase